MECISSCWKRQFKEKEAYLTDQAEDALVSFLKTLTDGYEIPNPRVAK